MTALFKRIILESLHASRLNQLALRSHRNQLLALGYHGILSAPAVQPFRYHHTAAEFREHLTWLSRHTTPVGLEDLKAWNSGERTYAKPPVLITFDDGYRNNFTVAAPILREMGIPAVFFLTTGSIGTDEVLWPDEVFLRVHNWTESSFLAPGSQPFYLPANRAERDYAAYFITESCKNIPESDRLEYIEYLRQHSPAPVMVNREAQEFMSWDEARKLVEMGFNVGSHTITHPILSQTSSAQLHRELFDSRAAIRSRTGSECLALAYPNGRPADFSGEVLDTVRKAGYDFAFTISQKRCLPSSDLLQIDRISPPGHVSLSTFALWVGGAREWASRRFAKPETAQVSGSNPVWSSRSVAP